MRTIETISGLRQVLKGCVLTIGNFDGVHVGHQEIVAVAKKIAREKGTELTAMTFEPHPVAALYPERAPGVLTPLVLKEHVLAQCGVDVLAVLKGDRELLSLSPEDFVARFLVENTQPSVVVEGSDFNFGAARAGSIETLGKFGAERGFGVWVIDPREAKLSTGQTVRVSSTMIRYMLESGHVADAGAALGRPYRLVGEIIPGRGIGKKLGFPTLNMKKPRQVIPAEGVYAGFVKVGEDTEGVLASKDRFPAIYSLGQARTYGDDFPLLIEAHLLGRQVDAEPGMCLSMDFVERIRAQHKFKTPEELSTQIAQDCDAAVRMLA
ncbi:MAG: riboflavin biosynthesis protein RibF [Planctomycetota bacterium]|jgi:riboflavin kinase/FMN adenylyltransferase